MHHTLKMLSAKKNNGVRVKAIQSLSKSTDMLKV